MTAVGYVTFGQRYRHEGHPVDRRAHPDGWFEYTAPAFQDAAAAARRHLLADDDPVARLGGTDVYSRAEIEEYAAGLAARRAARTKETQ